MKQFIFFIFIISCISLSAQKVGVNKTNPEYTLDVRSPSIAEPGQFNVSNLDKSRYLRFFSGSEMFPDPSMSWNPGHHLLFATYNDATFTFTEYMRIDTIGRVGIGIADPGARLDVRGGDWNLDAGKPGDLRVGNSTYNLRIGVATGGGGAGISRIYSSNLLLLGVDSATVMTLDKDGETGFGTTNPSQKVHINGKLKIGNDEKVPTEGTIRFNSTNKSFEGFDGSEWIKLGGSSPFGNTGTFSLPDTTYFFNPSGEEVTGVQVNGNALAIRSRLPIPSGIPGVNTYRIYVDIYQQNSPGGNWVNYLILNSTSEDSDPNYAQGFLLENGFLLIGDPKNKNVTKYEPSGSFWLPTHTYNSPNTSINDLFGWSIAYDQGITIIGAPEINVNSFVTPTIYGPGHAYIYDDLHVLEANIAGTGPVNGDGFGFSVGLSQNRAIVGAPFKDFGSTVDAGSATVLNFFNGGWSTNNTFYNNTVETSEQYGKSVAVEDNDYLYIGGALEGLDLYLVEDGSWTLKETIAGNGAAPQVENFVTQGISDLLYYNDPGLGKTPYLILEERDSNNTFQEISLLLNGNAPITGYDITNNKIYTISQDGRLFEFRK